MEEDLLLVMTHYIEKDQARRNAQCAAKRPTSGKQTLAMPVEVSGFQGHFLNYFMQHCCGIVCIELILIRHFSTLDFRCSLADRVFTLQLCSSGTYFQRSCAQPPSVINSSENHQRWAESTFFHTDLQLIRGLRI